MQLALDVVEQSTEQLEQSFKRERAAAVACGLDVDSGQQLAQLGDQAPRAAHAVDEHTERRRRA